MGCAAPSQGMLKVLKVDWFAGNAGKIVKKEIHEGLLNTMTHRLLWARAASQPLIPTSRSESASFTMNSEEQQQQTCSS